MRFRSELDLDVDASGKIKLHQRVHRLRGRVHDVEQALVRSHLELLTALLVDVGRTVDRELLDLRRQRNRPPHLRTGALGSGHDLARRRIEDAVIERLEPDPNVLAVHDMSDDGRQMTKDRRIMSSRRLALSVGPSSVLRPLSYALCRVLLGDTDHDAGADGFAALADTKPLLPPHP